MITAISIISTVVVAIATVVLTILTGRYVRLTKIMVTQEPNVYVDLEFPESIFRFVVGNSGSSPAKNIQFDILSDVDCIFSFYEKNKAGISTIPIFKNGISYLSPGRILKFWVGNFNNSVMKDSKCKEFRVVVRFENSRGKRFEIDTTIDLGQYDHVLFESFRDINMAIEKVIDTIRDVERDRRTFNNREPLIIGVKRKACPICGEMVNSSARKCKHCGEWIKEKSKNRSKRSS